MLNRIIKIFRHIFTVGILTICIFLGLVNITCENANAVVTKIESKPGEILYRSQTKLDDNLGKVWQVVLFKQVYPGQISNINLRLVGFPGSAELIHPQSLRITSKTGQNWNAPDIFLDEAPAPTIGQYDLTAILPQLPTATLNLAISLPGDKSINISVPAKVVEEWKLLITSNK
jgi:hypothetical protein